MVAAGRHQDAALIPPDPDSEGEGGAADAGDAARLADADARRIPAEEASSGAAREASSGAARDASTGAYADHEVAGPREQPELRTLLEEDPWGFQFFQCVRLLELLSPERGPVGGYGNPADEVVRFVSHASTNFPASEIQELALEDDGPARMMVNFIGLIGPQGVLPYHFTLLVAERLRAKDPALKAFLDIFHHRLVSLFYLAWRRNRYGVTYERGERDRLTEHLLDLLGLGIPGFQDRLGVDDEGLLFYASLLAPGPRSALALEQLLEDHFGVPAEVEQFVGGWYPLSSSDRCAVGDDEEGPANQLGFGAVAGDEIWDQQSRVRLRLGPLDRESYDDFLPGGRAHRTLKTLVRFFSHDQFEFELQLVLRKEDVPGCVLGPDEEPSPALGWGTWLRTEPVARDPDETILTL